MSKATFLNLATGTVFAAGTTIAGIAAYVTSDKTWHEWLWVLAGWLLACGAVLATYLFASGAKGNTVVPATVIFNLVTFVVGGLVVVSFWTQADAKAWAVSIMWAFACLALGAVAGLLFGVPSPKPGGSGEDSPIHQVSEWLTKIIVGLGLTNLANIPGLLDRWARYISNNNGLAKPSFAMGVIIYFCLLGFVSGYLLTRIFLTGFMDEWRSSVRRAGISSTTPAPTTPTPPITP